MSIQIKVKDPIDAIIHLKARKTLDGNVLILDHPDMDIVVSPAAQKILALSKEYYDDNVYASQSRLFEFLAKKGVVDPASIHGSNVFGSLEGTILENAKPEETDSFQVAIYSIAKFLIKEAPFFRGMKNYELEFEKSLLDPDEEHSTELGKVPHDKRKGSTTQYAGYNAAYGLYGIYEE